MSTVAIDCSSSTESSLVSTSRGSAADDRAGAEREKGEGAERQGLSQIQPAPSSSRLSHTLVVVLDHAVMSLISVWVSSPDTHSERRLGTDLTVHQLKVLSFTQLDIRLPEADSVHAPVSAAQARTRHGNPACLADSLTEKDRTGDWPRGLLLARPTRRQPRQRQ